MFHGATRDTMSHMAKKAPRGKILKLKPKAKAKSAAKSKPAKKKAGKVLQMPPQRATKTPAAKAVKAPPRKPRNVARPQIPMQVMPPPLSPAGTGEDEETRLHDALEELTAARQELARLGFQLSQANRELENRRMSSGSAEEHLRSELEAVRTDLRASLAELEISRNEVERLRLKLH